MKKLTILLFAAILVCLFAACPYPQFNDNTVTIQGTVTITRNGMPWNTDNFPSRHSVYAGEAVSRSLPPPTDRPVLLAYTTPHGVEGYVGVNYADAQQDEADLGNGTYKWSMKIPSEKLPGTLYFDVGCHMVDVDITFGMRNTGPYKMSEGIWVSNEHNSIDIGVINYEIIRLSGNLPVTVNGEPLDYEDEDTYQSAKMYVTHSYPWNRTDTVIISPNGDWSFNVVPSSSPRPLKFEVEVWKNNSIFRETLNPDKAVNISGTDMEVSFSKYPGIDFTSFNASGTIKFLTPKEPLAWYNVQFYERKNIDYSAWWNAGIIYGHGWYDLDVAWIQEWNRHADENNSLTDKNGMIQWKAVIPAFSFPRELLFKVNAATGDGRKSFEVHSSIVINDITDLNNINLGSFTVE